ncbi:phage holin family protein [Desulfovibrio sp. OttesenSCG-928-C06]|nr:phage holin family protein [Desulfovibrio sp. OttesenSCG-928-C06]
MKNFIEGLTVPLLLALFGGAARAVRFGVRSWRQFAAALMVSGFAGVIVHLLIQDASMSESVKAALVGLSGYSGGMILDALATRLQKGVERLDFKLGERPWDGVERRSGNRNEVYSQSCHGPDACKHNGYSHENSGRDNARADGSR